MARRGAVLFGMAAGAALGWWLAGQHRARHRTDLFSPRPLQRRPVPLHDPHRRRPSRGRLDPDEARSTAEIEDAPALQALPDHGEERLPHLGGGGTHPLGHGRGQHPPPPASPRDTQQGLPGQRQRL
ncbi:MAG TPA: hypothetical protein PKA50_17515, partial [Gemmatimonadales bacterium]|nr:hypothetical protein [Gemmatimonadales bacterium]